VVAAICTLWLAARAEGIGLGWVSILDPVRIGKIVDVPKQWIFVGYLCLAYPQHDDDTPELERVQWEQGRAAACFVLKRPSQNRPPGPAHPLFLCPPSPPTPP